MFTSKVSDKQMRKFKAFFLCGVQLAHPEATLSDAFKTVQFLGLCYQADDSDGHSYEMFVQLGRPLRQSQIRCEIANLHRSVDPEAIHLDTFQNPPEEMSVCIGCFHPRGRRKRQFENTEHNILLQDPEVMTTRQLRTVVTGLREKLQEYESLIETLYDENQKSVVSSSL